MKKLALLLSVIIVCGCSSREDLDARAIQIANRRKQKKIERTKAWENASLLLSTDSCGCKVYAIERDDCTIYVNNNGGIWGIPKQKDE